MAEILQELDRCRQDLSDPFISREKALYICGVVTRLERLVYQEEMEVFYE